ncbi:hypothetical protein J7I93_16880 [Bacillus sp. ISL-47]|uniref:hypothetical protein n=1 Tax=Bacillus sp. ISL-47 TaxID=2819130 RepID=UPI001BEA863D|nr:hypothetical protein [Bacillus sp. ISL-47]MBT2689863.1 hypothetical protein [Bacillus sp. ISL-47]MBT2710241.1 hypothetical protein [Pseudomonas sp. ISL-84]
MDKKIINLKTAVSHEKINEFIEAITFTKNFRSATAEEWYLFLPGFQDPRTKGAAGKAIIHYNLYGTKEIFINTTIIYDDPCLHKPEMMYIVQAFSEEVINRLVGYSDTLLSVHAGENSYDTEYLDGADY